VSLGAAFKWVSPIVLDGIVRLGVLPGKFETRAGQFKLRSEEFGTRVMFEPNAASSVSFAIGLGVSFLWVQETATGNVGIQGKTSSTQVMLIAARARMVLLGGRFLGIVAVDPGLTVPPLSVRSNQTEVARLGRPWVVTELGVGWSF
jgi:hypothetical protein